MKVSKVKLAHLPTPIVRANFLSEELGINLYIKRDDFTGIEISGNKIRKLEYVFKQLIDLGYNSVVTTGGIQSNHCRATAAAAVKLGIKPKLLLRVNKEPKVEGNYFLNRLFGAEIIYCTPEEYRDSRDEIMAQIAREGNKRGDKTFIIPEGASFGIGSMGYFEAMEEIVSQEREFGIKFDTVVVAVGSGGTYSGLSLANRYYNLGKRVVGFAVCDNSDYFIERIDEINRDSLQYLSKEISITKEEIEIIDNYVGLGYAINREEELNFIEWISRGEGVILDPVYTAKAMYGLYNEVKAGNFKEAGNILFIHTGGLFGLFPKSEQFDYSFI